MDQVKILIVEDDRFSAEDTKNMLEGLGYIVPAIVSSGEEAIEKVERHTPDLALMDIVLKSEMDGIETAERIRTRFNIPIVYVTAHAGKELMERAKTTEPFGYIIKPYKNAELHTAIEIALYKHKMEAQLRRTQKMEALGTLAGGIAHDFNNLLSVILANISLAEDDIKPEVGRSEFLEVAAKATMRAKDLTSRLVTFSEGGEPVKKVTSIGELVKDSVTSTVGGSGIDCEFSIPDDLSLVEIDPGQMKHVIHNITNNAREAMTGEGRITIYCENVTIGEQDALILNDGEYVKISIKDQGTGISKESLQKVFDPYFSTKEMGTHKGMGLGLSACYSIVKKHGGLITVESAVGIGTTTHIYLPAAGVESEKIGEKHDLAECQSTIRRILVMDDEEMMRTTASKILTRLGYEAEVSIDGAEAIELYKKARESGEPFDAVILDLTNQFGMGGKETIRKLLEIDPDVKSIVSTGYSNDSVVANFREYGFRGALTKPYTINELSNAINELASEGKE